MDRRVVWFFLNMFSFTTVYANDDTTQVDALIALKKALTDTTGILFRTWNEQDASPCEWFHVTCYSGNVTRIDLGNKGLSGTLPTELGKLTSLQYLEMYWNNIEGRIPKVIEYLPNLVSLDLYNNKLTGPIPWGLGNAKSLKYVRLNNNDLCGVRNIRLLNKINRRGTAQTQNNPRLCNSATDHPGCSNKCR